MKPTDEIKMLEAHLSHFGRQFPFPETPRFDVRPQIAPRPVFASVRIATIVVLFMVAAWLLAAPTARARLFQILGIGGMRILVDPAAPSEQPTEIFKPLDLLTGLALGGRTTLEDARAKVDFPVPIPTFPPDLGEPQAVYLQNIGTGPFVIMAWPDVEDPTRAAVVIYVLGPGTTLTKGPLRVWEETSVHGEPAIWTQDTYVVDVQGFHQPLRLTLGNALVWSEGDLTFRLEGAASVEEAIRMAESLSE